jgi:hypothetical protein
MARGSTQPLTEISTRNLSGGKGWLARRADNLTAICEDSFTFKDEIYKKRTFYQCNSKGPGHQKLPLKRGHVWEKRTSGHQYIIYWCILRGLNT